MVRSRPVGCSTRPSWSRWTAWPPSGLPSTGWRPGTAAAPPSSSPGRCPATASPPPPSRSRCDVGLIKGLLLLPFAPVQGVSWVADVVLDAAERELYDPAVVHARLAALNRAFDDGEIDAESFEREEERLL